MKQHILLRLKIRAVSRFLTLAFLSALLLAGCVAYKASLRTQDIGAIEPSGKYTVIRYASSIYEDYDAVVLLVPDSGKYTFEIYKPAFDYRSSGGLSAKPALDLAGAFLGRHPEFARSRIGGIVGPGGEVIGYEVRPLYKQTRFGQDDLITVIYLLKENNVIEVRVNLDEKVKNILRGGDSSSNR